MEKQNSHNRQKKIAIFNDFTGFGRCALTVQLPLISALGIQCCPVPTVIFSNHTAYPTHFRRSFDEDLSPYLAQWEQLGLRFSGIATGYFASESEIDTAREFIYHQKQLHTAATDADAASMPSTADEAPLQEADTAQIVLVDPVMGDHGRLYSSYPMERAMRLRSLLPLADILTPNLTEACLLTGTPFIAAPSGEQLSELGRRLIDLSDGRASVVISGIELPGRLGNFVIEPGREPQLLTTPKVGSSRSGTGDAFAAILIADAVNGAGFSSSVAHAASFLSLCLDTTQELGLPPEDGIAFETCLDRINYMN